MTLTETQLKLLQAIDDISKSNSGAAVTSDDVATRLNLEHHIVEYHFEYFAEHRLIIVFGKPNHLSGVSTYIIELTSKGKVALTNPNELNHSLTTDTPTLLQNFKYANIGIVQGGNNNIATANLNINNNLAEVIAPINKLYQLLEPLSEEERDEVTVHLDNLKEEVESPNRREPKKIKAYLKVLLVAGATLTIGAVQFTDQVMDIAQKLGFSFQLPYTSEHVKKIQPSP